MDIEKILSNMTIEQKFGQMTQLNRICIFHKQQFSRYKLTEQQHDSIGSVLGYGAEEDVKANFDEHLKNDPNRIPLLLMLDIIHGYKTAFPIPLALGASFNEEIAEKCCELSAKEAVKEGVTVTFSPMVDLSRDARWGRIMETPSEDPYLNGEFGKAMIRGYHKGGLACCVKHFAAYGAAEGGRDYNLVDISEHTLREYYLRAYHECLKENPELIMTSFNTLNGIPATGNKHLMCDILRDEWGYDGVIITDYNAVCEMVTHRYKENDRQAGKAALDATVDIEMCSPIFFLHGPDLVEKGEVSVERVDQSVKRILKLKDKLGLFENPYYKLTDEKASVTDEAREIVRKAAEETFVLLKNDGSLPLNASEKVVYVGPFVDSKEIIGNWSMFADTQAPVSIKSGVESLLGKKIDFALGCGPTWKESDESGIPCALELVKSADKVVLCVGEHQLESGECKSKVDIRLSAVQRKLIKEVHACGKKVVGVVFGGRPLALKDVVDCFDALLFVWQPGTEGGNAIANVLYGKVNPSGKLSASFPMSVGQCPLYYSQFTTGRPKLVDAGFFDGTSCYIDEKNTALFPFGYGLSYTNFALSTPIFSAYEMDKDGQITVSVDVENTGKMDGAEVVQMYIRDDFSEIVRPEKELKGHKKVYLKAGEKTTVTFTIDKNVLSYYGVDDKLVAEKGTFTVYISKDGVDFTESQITLK